MIILETEKLLLNHQDIKYKEFHQKLMPTVNPDTVMGVRVPELRKIAKNFPFDKKEFMSKLPHKFYEQNNLHAFLIEDIKDFDECIYELQKFLPYVDNWATCDMMRPKVFKANKDKLLPYIKKWLKSEKCYTKRYAIGLLNSFYLDDGFDTKYLDMAIIKSDEYYINMMIAWYFATALTKQYELTLPYITNYKLPKWVHNKAIQKAVESRAIGKDKKEFLKKYKIK